MGFIVKKTSKKGDTELTKKQSKAWLRETCLTYLIGQMMKAGYSVPQIAKCANVTEEKVQKRISNVINKNWENKSGLDEEED